MSRIGPAAGSRFGAICIAVQGEIECGDGWALAQDDDWTTLMVVDGLGHGSLAAVAAESAQRLGSTQASIDRRWTVAIDALLAGFAAD